MPVVDPSSYTPHPSIIYKYSETIISSLFGNVQNVSYVRERLELKDGDFLDLDWLRNGNHRLVILSSGMEGSSDRHYMKSTAKYFHERNWDVLAWNYRGCSGELNRLPILYSYAETKDFAIVIDHSIKQENYSQIALIGFSMGGCLVTKYLGGNHDPRIVSSVTFSVSCDLKDSMVEVERTKNFIYNRYFVLKLKKKLALKAKKFEAIRSLPIDGINSFDDYLRCYTLAFHEFSGVDDFYEKSSCKQFISSIRIPSLMINAMNDPILGNNCYPYELAKDHFYFYLETPTTGGHLGFPAEGPEKSWMPKRAYEFIMSHLPAGT